MMYLHLLTFACATAFAAGRVRFGGPNHDGFVNTEDNVWHDDHHYHRSLASEEELTLQLKWWNWALCSKRFPLNNNFFTPMSGVVPANTVFLTSFPHPIIRLLNICKLRTTTHRGTIRPGQQTIFMPLDFYGNWDVEDDWEKGCVLQNETDAERIKYAKTVDAAFNDPAFTANLYLYIDGKSAAPIYLYDESKRYLSACDDKDQTIKGAFPLRRGDRCDNEPYEPIGGMDIGPLLGWYGIDNRTWADGESHTYEFGALSSCFTAKYILTAKEDGREVDQCGLFGLGIFCPKQWFFALFS